MNFLLSSSLKPRAKDLVEMAESAKFLFRQRPLALDNKAEKLINSSNKAIISKLIEELESLATWEIKTLEAQIRSFSDSQSLKMGKIAQPLRAMLTGSTISPGIFDVLFSLGQEETLARLRDNI